MQFSDNQTLLSCGESWIESVETINGRYVRVRFQDDLPQFLCPGHVVENMSWTPDLTVGTCTVRNNRARGLLISTPGKVLVEQPDQRERISIKISERQCGSSPALCAMYAFATMILLSVATAMHRGVAR